MKGNGLEFDTDKYRVVIGIPYLQIDGNFLRSILQVARANIVRGWATVGGTLITAARNKAIEVAYSEEPDFTHFIFIDADMGNFGPQHIVKLVLDDLPVVSALVCMRKAPFTLVLDFGEENNTVEYIHKQIKDRSIVRSTHVGLAFTCITKEVLDAIKEETDQGPQWFTLDRSPRDSFEDEKEKFIRNNLETLKDVQDASWLIDSYEEAISFGQASHIGARILGEDIAFSHRCSKLDIPVFVDCGVSVGHVGEAVFDFRDAFTNAPKKELSIVEA